jgi:hypothetical protein
VDGEVVGRQRSGISRQAAHNRPPALMAPHASRPADDHIFAFFERQSLVTGHPAIRLDSSG